MIALAAWVSPRNRTLLGWLVTAGLLLSALGDVLLEAGHFLPGLVAFLAAHVAYVVAFVSDERRLRLARLLPFAAWTAGAFGLLRPRLGEMTVPVALYIAVITLMMWRASARLGSPTVSPVAARLGSFSRVRSPSAQATRSSPSTASCSRSPESISRSWALALLARTVRHRRGRRARGPSHPPEPPRA